MILLIIDMQEEFPTARATEVVKACRREIWRARKLQAPILTVTYDYDDEFLPCLPEIEQALYGYDKRYATNKRDDGGSKEVIEACVRNVLDTSLFRICGVNVGACVKATVTPLIDIYENSRFEFVYEACGCDLATSVETGLNRLCCDQPRTKVVYYRSKVMA